MTDPRAALDSESGRLVKLAKSNDDDTAVTTTTTAAAAAAVAVAVAVAGTLGPGGETGTVSPLCTTPKIARETKPRPVLQEQERLETFEVFVAKEDFKFSCSHFVAFEGYRERLHGHNYSVGVRLKGQVCDDGYAIDFGVIKQNTRKICKELNERFLCPTKSKVMTLTISPTQVTMVCQDGATFVLPKDDCALLPLLHSTAEELAHYVFTRLLRMFSLDYLHLRGVTEMAITVSEMPNQAATYTGKIPPSEDLIRDPPLGVLRRVVGCCVRDGEDDRSNVNINTK